MAVSGSTNFELDVSDYIEEAYERCGLEVRTGYDLKTAKRSLNLMLGDWANRGLNQWTIEQATVTLTQGTGNYSLGASTIDILNAVVRRSDTDYALDRISRSDYINIPSKTQQARPSQFFVDRQIDPTLKLWPIPENSTDTVIIDKLVRMDDADTYTNTMDVPFRFYPCLAAGLAYYLAQKYKPELVQAMKLYYEDELARALAEDGSASSTYITPKAYYPST